MFILDAFKTPMVEVRFGDEVVHLTTQQFTAMVMATGAIARLSLPLIHPFADDCANVVHSLGPVVQAVVKTKLTEQKAGNGMP